MNWVTRIGDGARGCPRRITKPPTSGAKDAGRSAGCCVAPTLNEEETMAYGPALARSGDVQGHSLHLGSAAAGVAAVPVVDVRGVVKRFGATTALAGVDLAVMPGEVHALVGRNGAGKSTLVSLLAGLARPDAGQIRFAGEPALGRAGRSPGCPSVACVHQHSTAIRELSIAENLFLNRQPYARGAIDWRTMRCEARALLDRWHIDVHEDTRCAELDASALQLVEIARALSQGARLIVLDEPTAQLDRGEIRRLFGRIEAMRREGATFLFISHRLQEVYDICQMVTVLRDGRRVLTAPVEGLPRETLIDAMTGETGGDGIADIGMRKMPTAEPLALEVAGLAGTDFDAVSFAVRRGEVVGLVGASTSGRVELAEAIAGLRKPRSGAVRVHARGGTAAITLPYGDVEAALDAGVGCVPKARHREGLVPGQSIAENVTMTLARRLGPWGIVRDAVKSRLGAEAIASLGIVARGPQVRVATLSSGNRQKVVMARALATNPDVLVLVDPTLGVDVKSKEILLAQIDLARDAGRAVIVSSGELDDLRSCDRVFAMFRGRIVKAFPAFWADRELIAAIEGVDLDKA